LTNKITLKLRFNKIFKNVGARRILELLAFMDVTVSVALYTGRHKYFDKTKVKYTHSLNLLLVNFGINGKVI